MTLSDVSVAGDRLAGFGDGSLVAGVEPAVVRGALQWVDRQITQGSERMKASRQPMPLLAVGGGAHLVPDGIPGTLEVIRPNHHAVANAYGAAVAEASGTIDRVYEYEASSREECLDDAREEARRAAVATGADPDRVRITSVVEVPMTYIPGGRCRVQVKAAGPLG